MEEKCSQCGIYTEDYITDYKGNTICEFCAQFED